ncbi:ACT domain-containing protein [Nocardia caishijiensis]|uniref:Homoserine dehydrogenase n=1 Tax=Nocardia caishijiensis TaxID=184756 RepID=A0ABQ6YEA3_9NOCA|nr:ACT domain-containing protein [Nocardia caishijiensis]KAF0835742.1 homoserine dehydrogenase [Nocardia caishijiensis]
MTTRHFRSPSLRVAVLGTGALAGEVVRIIGESGAELAARVGARLVLDAESADLVVDTTATAQTMEAVLDALRAGRSVVTANAALVAEHGLELASAAEEFGADLCFEAAVAGGVPVVRPLTQSLSGDRVREVLGVFAAADAHAAAVLATLAFHTRVEVADVHFEEFEMAGEHDLAAAEALSLRLRQLTVCTRISEPEDGGKEWISVRVHPALLPATHPLAQVESPFSAVTVDAEGAGRLMFSGRDATAATASALLGDLVSAARNRVNGGRALRPSHYAELPVAPFGDTPTRYYLNLRVTDHAGALAQVASVFAEHGVSIARVRQEHHGDDAHLIVLTHRARESALADTLDALADAPCVCAVLTRWRLEGADDTVTG